MKIMHDILKLKVEAGTQKIIPDGWQKDVLLQAKLDYKLLDYTTSEWCEDTLIIPYKNPKLIEELQFVIEDIAEQSISNADFAYKNAKLSIWINTINDDFNAQFYIMLGEETYECYDLKLTNKEQVKFSWDIVQLLNEQIINVQN